jgi:hypothetical protein
MHPALTPIFDFLVQTPIVDSQHQEYEPFVDLSATATIQNVQEQEVPEARKEEISSHLLTEDRKTGCRR